MQDLRSSQQCSRWFNPHSNVDDDSSGCYAMSAAKKLSSLGTSVIIYHSPWCNSPKYSHHQSAK